MDLRCLQMRIYPGSAGLGLRKLSAIPLLNSLYVCVCIKERFVCVEVLRPSQPNGVMSSAVSLPNHKFYWAGLVL